MGFSQALSGLNAASTNLNVVSNNIANSQTVGFKSSTTQFADVYAGAKVGLGTRVSDVVQNFNSGNLETTDRGLDLAISGSGFFRLEQGGQVVYSRNGQLTLTSDGYLENAQGARLMGADGVIQILRWLAGQPHGRGRGDPEPGCRRRGGDGDLRCDRPGHLFLCQHRHGLRLAGQCP
ncbi:flagellar hook-basal body complex protein [Azotobacter chroococcum]